jgi:putative endonuclease
MKSSGKFRSKQPRSRSVPSPQRLGIWGERCVARFLRKSGYTVLYRNWRCRRGEIDLVAVSGRTLVFVEIKTRRHDVSQRFSPIDGVNTYKQQRIAALSEIFIFSHRPALRRLKIRSVRYDVVGVVYRGFWRSPEIRHYHRAFSPTRAIELP